MNILNQKPIKADIDHVLKEIKISGVRSLPRTYELVENATQLIIQVDASYHVLQMYYKKRFLVTTPKLVAEIMIKRYLPSDGEIITFWDKDEAQLYLDERKQKLNSAHQSVSIVDEYDNNYDTQSHTKTNDQNKKENECEDVKSLLGRLCFCLGLNAAHDYDGIESQEDVEIYSRAVFEKVEKLMSEKRSQEK